MIDPQVTDSHAPVATTRVLRQFAALWMLFFGALALWQYFRHDSRAWATIFGSLSVSLGPLGLLRPALIRPAFVVWMAMALPIGAVVSRVVLAILYYFLFALVGVLFKLVRRDALNLRRPETDTYWHVRPQVKDLRQYLRQS
jgi:hypothetical protein